MDLRREFGYKVGMTMLREYWVRDDPRFNLLVSKTRNESHCLEVHVREVIEPQLRNDLTQLEIKFINEDKKCDHCGHLDLFHTDDTGHCLIYDCKDERCGHGS